MPSTETTYDEWIPLTKENIEPLLTEIATRESTVFILEPKSDMDLETLQSLQSNIHLSIESANWAWWQLTFMKDEFEQGSDTLANIENGLATLTEMLSKFQTYARECFEKRAEKGEELDL